MQDGDVCPGLMEQLEESQLGLTDCWWNRQPCRNLPVFLSVCTSAVLGGVIWALSSRLQICSFMQCCSRHAGTRSTNCP